MSISTLHYDSIELSYDSGQMILKFKSNGSFLLERSFDIGQPPDLGAGDFIHLTDMKGTLELVSV